MTIPPLIRREFKDYVEKHRLSPEDQERMLAIVEAVYNKSTYDPEEPIGVVTAQSLSEPATQMTMRTYHFAGTAGIQVTLGLPRMIEIFDARKEPRTPTMTIYIEKDHQTIEQVKRVAEQIKEIKLKDIVVSNVIDLTDMWIKCRLDPAKLKEFEIDAAALPKKIKLRGADTSYEGGQIMLKSKNLDIRALYKMKYQLLETHIKGIKGVSQVVV
jgi:DNA-directed RNA polymerase subunit A"